jgi:(5-formylfuran-3-yl)methyl phosphate synthase
MTRLLASVTSVAEAQMAMEGGADIIDLKNPLEGALGALSLSTIARIVDFVAGRRTVSATIGDLPMQPSMMAEMVRKTAATGVDIVKIGLFGDTGHAQCIGAVAPLATAGIHVVAVLFADTRPDFGILPYLAQAGFMGVMLDTADKKAGRLVDCLPESALGHFLHSGKGLGLLTGLAGSLRLDDVPALAPLAPDYLGFRGGLCTSGDRNAAFDPARLNGIARVLREYNSSAEKAA